ncbi:MAG: hypothetical protein VYE40_04980 [Myxococcota bacterium]|nr:hypothetical protein [Myxococcota bacterium]MEC9440444.1 hypothetical protein [Myxococcota bacterium]
MMWKKSALGGILLASVWLSGCGEPVYVGPECESNRDCEDVSFCLQGSMYPGGVCTMGCESVADCPGASWCVGLQGGVCLLECVSDEDCRDGWVCTEQSIKNSQGQPPVRVCLGDS